MLSHLLVMRLPRLGRLSAQCWPNLLWGQFNNTLQLLYYGMYLNLIDTMWSERFITWSSAEIRSYCLIKDIICSVLYCEKNLQKHLCFSGNVLSVVYFNQQIHACSCIRMVENNEKHLKIMKKYLFYHEHQRCIKKNEEKKFVGQQLGVTPKSWLAPKSWLLIRNLFVFDCFST